VAAMTCAAFVAAFCLQDWDTGRLTCMPCKVVTQRKPTEQEYQAMDFAWRVCRHVKSNTIVFASPDHVLGVGAGQMSRVDSAKIAVMRAATHGLDLKGSAVASDAFYPFRDGVRRQRPKQAPRQSSNPVALSKTRKSLPQPTNMTWR